MVADGKSMRARIVDSKAYLDVLGNSGDKKLL